MPAPQRSLRAGRGSLRMTVGSAAVLVGLSLMTGCAASAPADSDPVASEPMAEVPAEEPTSASSADGSAVGSDNDICALVSDDELAAVLGSATVSDVYTMGGLTEEIGGQCVWSDDPAGEVVMGVTTQLELVVWDPSGVNPPPPEAPTAGTAGVVIVGDGAYFTTDDRVFWLRLTGERAFDAATIASMQVLANALDARL